MHRSSVGRPLRLASKRYSAKSVNPSAASQLIIAHGLLGNAMNWATAARHMVEHPLLRDKLRGAHCVDMRNHGASPHSPDHTNAALASDLETVVLREQQELQRSFANPTACSTHNSILIGHSMGGLAVMGALLRRANEDMLLPQRADSFDDNDASSGEGGASPFGSWSAERRRGCSAGMRAVNDDFGFPTSLPISDVLYNNSSSRTAAASASSPVASRIPRLGRVAGAIIVDVTPTMRLGEQRSSADNVKETLERMTRVNLHAIHSYEEAGKELLRVGMADKAMRDFVTTNIIIDTKDKSAPAQWRCNLPVLAGDYGSFQSTITAWYDAAAEAEAKRAQGDTSAAAAAVVTPHRCSLPVLFVFGEKSPYNESAHRRQIPSYFSNATQVVVDGAGHFVHYEKAKEFVEVVAPFIASLTAKP